MSIPSTKAAWLWGALLALVSAALTLHPEHDTDLYWHMALGQSVLEQGTRTVVDPISFEDFERPHVVPEWLWGVLTLGLYRAGGYAALHVLLALLAAASALSLSRALGRYATGGAGMLVSLLVMIEVLGRIRVRPEAAMSLLVPASMLVIQRYTDSQGRARAAWGAGLLGIELLWAQLHGSFILLPALFAVPLAFALWRAPPAQRQLDLGVLLALSAGLLTSAYGSDLLAYLLAHTGSDATLHLADMHPPTWDVFNPGSRLYGPLYLALWLMAVLGMARARQLFLVELGWALLGVYFVSSSVRFLALGALLLAPLAARGLSGLVGEWEARARLWLLLPLLGLLPLYAFGKRIHERQGPLGVLGPAPGVFPFAGIERLRSEPSVKRVLSDFWSGGAINFLLDGRARTYVDGRTPLYFDATEFAVSRDIIGQPAAMRRTLARYRADAVVLPRGSAACDTLPREYVPLVVEAQFTTFVRNPASSPLERVLPCGPELVDERLCSDGGAALARDLARLRLASNAPLLAYLQAERALRCQHDAALAEQRVPERFQVEGYAGARDRLLARALLVQRRGEEAAEVLAPSIEAGDPASVALLRSELPALSAATARRLLELVASTQQDATPAEVQQALALVCAAQGDAECVRFHGLRAAVKQGAAAAWVLNWLKQHAPNAWERRDAARWLDALTHEPNTATPKAPAPSPETQP